MTHLIVLLPSQRFQLSYIELSNEIIFLFIVNTISRNHLSVPDM